MSTATKKAAITFAFIGGLFALLWDLSADADPVRLGSPVPGFAAAALSVVVAVLAASPLVRWLGGDAAVNEIVKQDASRARGAAMRSVERTGLSARDMRIMMGALAYVPALALLIGVANVVNTAGAGAPVSVTCQAQSATRNQSTGRYDVTLSCSLPTGDPETASGRFDRALKGELRGEARRGALGVWLVDRSTLVAGDGAAAR